MDEAAEARRRRRSQCEVRIIRAGDEKESPLEDALYWDRIPRDERAAFVWQLSLEVFALAHPEATAPERRLSRSIVRVVRG